MYLFHLGRSGRSDDASRKAILRRFSRPPGSSMILLMLLLIVFEVMGGTATAGFKVQDGVLLDGNDSPFIIRGINHPHVWYPSHTPKAISEIADTGANAVRVVLGSGNQWGPTPASRVADIIAQLKENKMIAILEIHDCTGYGESPDAVPLSTAVDYWLDIQNVLRGEEDYVVLNIANEPLGNDIATTTWADIHMRAINRLRNAGLTHTLMVDGANWGQDWEQIMLNDAPQVLCSDPLKNIIFSVHMYESYNDYNVIDAYISTFVRQLKMPLVIGAFGPEHLGEDVDEASIMELANQYQIGYIGWSWSGNSEDLQPLDITIDFKIDNLSFWGDFLINNANGIKNTAELAGVFSDDPIDPNMNSNPPTPSNKEDKSNLPGCGDTNLMWGTR